MRKIIPFVTFGLLSMATYSQANWQKGGNNALPAGSLPILGTTYNAQLNFITNNATRMTILGGLPGGATTGFVGTNNL